MKRERRFGLIFCGCVGALALAAIALAAQQQANQTHIISLSSGVSIELTSDWQRTSGESAPPPSGLGPYAPPFHFSQALVLASDEKHALLELATSDNPLMGHDSYYLDSQMHSAPGSGMSMSDFLFYLFLPPSRACLEHVLQTDANASRSPQTGDPTEQSDLQVFYPCEYSMTASDFYSSQLSSGIEFSQGIDGRHALPVVSDFHVAPMEQMDISGMTFFIFEAKSQHAVDETVLNRFDLPKDLQGAYADFFWAIGAESPFPFPVDQTRKDVPLIHLAYAGLALGPNPDKHAEFMDLLNHIRYHEPAEQSAPSPQAAPAELEPPAPQPNDQSSPPEQSAPSGDETPAPPPSY